MTARKLSLREYVASITDGIRLARLDEFMAEYPAIAHTDERVKMITLRYYFPTARLRRLAAIELFRRAVLAGASAMVAVRTIAHVFSVSERTAKYYRAAAKITDVFPSPGKHK
ncbi:MAG: hypothetical protein A2231_03125 [Candidatus Firestonebacteria bacterium RIFOXYA2_FULL_40_8]|nr:MAG: hypothetical protein A2231_03125 [Candidatus Firestonebacteria bacterium RIFOXYA2_FULL_40_8]